MSLDFYLYEIRKCGSCKDMVFHCNITHNLAEMAGKAGIYKALWHPEKLKNVKTAKDLISLLEAGLIKLRKKPEFYKKYDSPNGWGLYSNFVPFVEEVLAACKEFPDARIETSN